MESSNLEIQLIYIFIHSIIVDRILPRNNAICLEKGVITKVANPVNKIKVVKHQPFEEGEQLTPAEPLGNEMALITLTYRKEGDTFDQPYHKVTQVVSKQLNVDLFEQEELEFLAKADFTYDLEINLLDENKFLGGYKGNWTVDWDKLESGEEIIFHAFANNNPSEEEMFELMTGLSIKSQVIPSPEIITVKK